MKLMFRDVTVGGELLLAIHEPNFDRYFFTRDHKDKYLTIAWNTGPAQQVTVDEVGYTFPPNTVLPLLINQSFRFERSEDIIVWQFNRDFYCIIDNDKEVSCIGFIFGGGHMFIELDEREQHKMHTMVDIFKDELADDDDIQATMLRTLLVRLIIKVTRLARKQFVDGAKINNSKLDIIRQFTLLVEENYKQQHQVQFYANALAKSPKTLSNLFAMYNQRSPLQIIQERIIQEAKRFFYYTDRSAKEIAQELGFEDAAHFSRFFKNQTEISPSDFKKALQKV
ncbi:helix-turn-helix domain-containing protein [Chitinophaga agrisoli]|uniref:Helix-turn-helix domain-containing protein n=1 Tax=Chitinophaga agrisoli TaxID=2607653 RepID=A0A5B2VTX6_9BACT|nr:helix-turn-helix domain-containing protein [Chitinophaga agrisoli]KAA2241696.1 helix-turn-helix domain-containing protein [Chitinophaga agrisoli]